VLIIGAMLKRFGSRRRGLLALFTIGIAVIASIYAVIVVLDEGLGSAFVPIACAVIFWANVWLLMTGRVFSIRD
jgi:hypothetical protein